MARERAIRVPSGRSPRRAVQPTGEDRGQRAIFGAIALGAVLIVLGLLVQQLVTLLLAVLITVILSLPLAACATRLERYGVPRALGALLALALGVGAVGGLIALLIPTLISQVKTLIDAAPSLVHSIELKISSITGQRPGHVASQVQQYVGTYAHDPSRLLGPLASIGLSAATVVGGLVIAVITAYYIAVTPEPLLDGAASLFPPERRPDVMRVMMRLRAAWLGWLRGLAIAVLIIGVLLYLGLQLLVGLKFALFFAVFSAVAEVIPYFGSLISGIPPVAYALTVSPGTAVAVLAMYIAIHQIEANVIGPVVMSRAVHLHPAVIAFGVVAVGSVFGFLGLVIAVPILSLLMIVVEEAWVLPRERAAEQVIRPSASPARAP